MSKSQCVACLEFGEREGVCDYCGLRWHYADRPDPEVPSLEATAKETSRWCINCQKRHYETVCPNEKAARERERRDRWWSAFLTAYQAGVSSVGRLISDLSFDDCMKDADSLLACFDKRFPPEEQGE